MTAREFCYWLQGYFELKGDDGSLTVAQLECVRRHLSLVFHHEIDPSYPGNQEAMQEIHDGHPAKSQIGGIGPGGQVLRC